MTQKNNADLVQKISNDIFLYFKKEENGKYSFSSNNKSLQSWCESVKNKKVKLSGIYFVVKAAKEYLKNGAPEVKNRMPDFGDDDVSKLNYLCQQKWHKTPVWETVSVEHDPCFPDVNIVTVQVTMPDGYVYSYDSCTAKRAKQIVARTMIEIFFEE